MNHRQGSGTESGSDGGGGAGGSKRSAGIGAIIGPDGKEMDVLHVDIENLDGRTMRDEEIQVCML